jgi:hypothetical protein
MSAVNCARLAANFFTILRRFWSRSFNTSLDMGYFLNGNLNAASSAWPSASVLAVVVIVIFMPRNASILSY